MLEIQAKGSLIYNGHKKVKNSNAPNIYNSFVAPVSLL